MSPLEALRQVFHCGVIIRGIVKGEVAKPILAELESLQDGSNAFSNILAGMTICKTG